MFSTQYLDALGSVLRGMFWLAVVGVISIFGAFLGLIGLLLYWAFG
jgi:hypothetical protein